MTPRRNVLFGIAIGVLTFSGCAQDTQYGIGAPRLDSHFGEAVRKARAMQVIRPDGVEVNDEGYSGKAAQSTMERLDGGAKQPGPAQATPVPDVGKAVK